MARSQYSTAPDRQTSLPTWWAGTTSLGRALESRIRLGHAGSESRHNSNGLTDDEAAQGHGGVGVRDDTKGDRSLSRVPADIHGAEKPCVQVSIQLAALHLD